MQMTLEEQDKLNLQLFYAIEQNDLEAVKAAVETGADVNARNKHDYTPLMVSTEILIDIKIMSFLLEHGANPNLQEKDGNTALHFYFIISDISKVKLLLDHNVDMYIKRNDGRTAFALALLWHEYNKAELYVVNGYIPTKEEFEIVKDIKLKMRFMELARTVKVNALQKEEKSEVCCDECFDF